MAKHVDCRAIARSRCAVLLLVGRRTWWNHFTSFSLGGVSMFKKEDLLALVVLAIILIVGGLRIMGLM